MNRHNLWGLALGGIFALSIIWAVSSNALTENNSQTSSTDIRAASATSIPDVIEPPCLAPQEIGSADERPGAIDIRIPDSRDWIVNLASAELSEAPNIRSEFKKTFAATASVTYQDRVCTYPAEVRLSGDWKDHLDLYNYRASLDVELRGGHILGFTQFKALLPGTRGGVDQLISNEIVRSAGLLVPRGFLVPVTVNGSASEMLIEESIEKELLEGSGIRESLLLEIDESLIWEYLGYTQENRTRDLLSPRTTNTAWATASEPNRQIAWRGMSLLADALAEALPGDFAGQGPQLSDSILSGGNERIRSELAQFRALMVAMGAGHALPLINRKFVFDPLENGLRPVYREGELTLEIDPDPETLRGVTEEDVQALLTKLQQVDFESILNNVKANGGRTSPDRIEDVLESTMLNLTTLLPRTRHQATSRNTTPPRSPINFTLRTVFGRPGDWSLCDESAQQCSEHQLSLDEERDLLAGRLTIDGQPVRYFGESPSRYRSDATLPSTLSRQLSWVGFGPSEYATVGDVAVQIDPKAKTLDAELFGHDSRIVIRGGSLDRWVISVSGPIGLVRDITQRADANLLTGCLNIVDVEMSDVSVTVEGGACEDGLNVVRADGTVRELILRDADQDAIDMDFSHLVIDTVFVERSGNDCLDVSAGTYEISNLSASHCGDKGLSVGEGSLVSADSITVNGAIIGIAAKDSSTLTLGSVLLENTPTCIAAYRKKPEFNGASVFVEDLQCPGGTNYVQEGSRVLVDNLGSVQTTTNP